jgi:membrane protein YdbS with pleckstrin-like domain
METIFGLFFCIIGAFVWLIPLVAILLSSRTSGGEKVAWLLAVVFISWFAWIFYLLLAPLTGNRMRV